MRQCAGCDVELPKDASPSRRYCTSKCGDRARFRAKYHSDEGYRLKAIDQVLSRYHSDPAYRAKVIERAKARQRATYVPAAPVILTCACGSEFVRKGGNHRRCERCAEKARLAQGRKRRKVSAPHHKGNYARRAKQVRDAANAVPSTLCWRCHRTLAEIRLTKPKAKWTAGHLNDGEIDGPLAPECSCCNFGAGARLTNTRRRPKTSEVSRSWI